MLVDYITNVISFLTAVLKENIIAYILHSVNKKGKKSENLIRATRVCFLQVVCAKDILLLFCTEVLV